jgi:hypothetical protein
MQVLYVMVLQFVLIRPFVAYGLGVLVTDGSYNNANVSLLRLIFIDLEILVSPPVNRRSPIRSVAALPVCLVSHVLPACTRHFSK